ncbi:MAG: branched-chain amino acid ABC transporter permease [Rhodospirillales bacterium]|nr:branched-chain amino acid ABC transporter permease [Rhodospirillales bacterium]
MTALRNIRPTTAGIALAAAVLLGLWPLLPAWAAHTTAVSLGGGLVALGLMILIRFGLVSFGQGLFFAIGGYAAALANQFLGITDMLVLSVAGIAAAGAIAWALGYIVRGHRGIFFAMLNLAFSMILFGILAKTVALGSTDGFSVGVPTLLGVAPGPEAGRLTFVLFGFIVISSALVAWIVDRILASPVGYAGQGVRENELRLRYLGVSARGAVHLAYIMAAKLAALGGVFTVLLIGHVTPEDTAYWTKSGEFVFVAILGGAGNVAAPFIAQTVFELVRTFALQYVPEAWQMLLGITLLLVILFLPGGLWSLVDRLRGRNA